jgi:serine/threonine-protein kinase
MRGNPLPVLDGLLASTLGLAVFTTSSDGSLAYVPGDIAENQLVLVDRKGTALPLTKEPGLYQHPRFSPDGRRIAAEVRKGAETDIWAFDLTRGTTTRLTFDQGLGPTWSPDGSRLALIRVARDGSYQPFWVEADGSGTLAPLGRNLSFPSWVPWSISPDGDLVAFQVMRGKDRVNFVLASPDGSDFFVLRDEFGESYWPQFSPDGRYVAYVSVESGRPEVYVRAVDGPGKWLVSRDGGGEPLWSGDGSERFYRRGDEVLSVPTRLAPDFSAGTPVVLFEGRYDSGGTDQHWGVAPDGQTFVMVTVGQVSATPIRLVLNWSEELRRLLPMDN